MWVFFYIHIWTAAQRPGANGNDRMTGGNCASDNQVSGQKWVLNLHQWLKPTAATAKKIVLTFFSLDQNISNKGPSDKFVLYISNAPRFCTRYSQTHIWYINIPLSFCIPFYTSNVSISAFNICLYVSLHHICCMYICVYLQYVCIHICGYLHMYIYVHTYICIYIHSIYTVCILIQICTYIFTCICTYMCMYMYICVYIHICV